MADVRPFAALRPEPELAPRICAPPYDVMSEAEARAMAARDELSFIHVSRPEVNFSESHRPSETELAEAARAQFGRLIEEGALQRDAQARFHLYRQEVDGHVQTGIVALASCADYVSGTIVKHELTRVEKEADRMRHIEALNAHTGPVFLFHEASNRLKAIVTEVSNQPPEVDFAAEDAVRHTAWCVRDTDQNLAIQEAFSRIPKLYVADGHHRSAAAVRVWEKRGQAAGAAGFLAVIFPGEELRILPYHRVLCDLNGQSAEEVLSRLAQACEAAGEGTPEQAGEFSIYLGRKPGWRRFRFRASLAPSAGPADRLDVARLQEQVLGPLFSIEDPRTSDRIDFVGGIRGISALDQRVESGRHACALAMFPTGIQELANVADAGGVMPPKSTWFEPKLRDAMFCHILD